MADVTTADYWPHPLTTAGRTLLAVPPGATVRDVVRLARPSGQVDVTLNGRRLAAAEWDAPVGGGLVAVRAVAAGRDSDARTILQLAVLVASIYVGNIAALGAWAPYAAAAVSIVGNLIINALVPPEVPGAEKPPLPLYSLTGGSNRARPYQPVLLVLGRHRVFPDLAAREYVERRGDNSYLHQLFDFGVGVGDVDNLRIGDTPFENFQEADGRWVEPGDRPPTIDHAVETLAGAVLGDDEVQPNSRIHPYRATGWVTRTAPLGTSRIVIELTGQLMYVRDDGKLGVNDIWVVVQWQRESVWAADPAAGWEGQRWIHMEGREADAVRLAVEVPRLAVDDTWQVRIARDRPLGWDSAGTNDKSDKRRDTASVASVRCYRPTWAAPPTERLEVVIRATGQINGRVDRLNAMVSCVGWTYDAVAGWRAATQRTSNPAGLFVAYCLGWQVGGELVAGMGHAAADLDMDGLAQWHEWCERERLACNALLDGAPESHDEVLRLIARCGRASPSWQSGRLGVVWEDAERAATALVTAGNILAGTFRIQYAGAATADEVAVRFLDPAADWQYSIVRARVPGLVGAPRETAEVTLRGVTDRAQAQREARLIAARQKYHRRRISWRMGREGYAIARGDVVLAANDLVTGGTAGRVVGVVEDVPATLQLDRPVAAAGWILVRLRDGTLHQSRYRVWRGPWHGDEPEPPPAPGRAVILADPLPEPPGVDGAEPRDLLWRALREDDDQVRLRIVGVRPLRGGEVELAAIDEDARYWAEDVAEAPVAAGAGDPDYPRVAWLALSHTPRADNIFITAALGVAGKWQGCVVTEAVDDGPAVVVSEGAETVHRWPTSATYGQTVAVTVTPGTAAAPTVGGGRTERIVILAQQRPNDYVRGGAVRRPRPAHHASFGDKVTL